jgi:hypothetical protein
MMSHNVQYHEFIVQFEEMQGIAQIIFKYYLYWDLALTI